MTTQQGETGGDSGSVELRGKVKWFNAVKGYGFLALDSDNSDAFLHVTTLRQAGHEDLKPGATVVCAGVRGPKGWQVMKVIEVDSSTGESRALVDYHPATYVDSTSLYRHYCGSGEIIWRSELDGWGHLYITDQDGKIENQITKGQWVVRGVTKVDEKARQIVFTASGMNAGEDPYFIH